MHSTIEGARSISAAFPPNPGFISWDFRGSREGDRLSFGASGMTPSMLRTALPHSADISRTMLRRRPRVDDRRRPSPHVPAGHIDESASSLRAARGGGAVIRDGGVMGRTDAVAHDPSAPSGHLLALRAGRK